MHGCNPTRVGDRAALRLDRRHPQASGARSSPSEDPHGLYRPTRRRRSGGRRTPLAQARPREGVLVEGGPSLGLALAWLPTSAFPSDRRPPAPRRAAPARGVGLAAGMAAGGGRRGPPAHDPNPCHASRTRIAYGTQTPVAVRVSAQEKPLADYPPPHFLHDGYVRCRKRPASWCLMDGTLTHPVQQVAASNPSRGST